MDFIVYEATETQFLVIDDDGSNDGDGRIAGEFRRREEAEIAADALNNHRKENS